MEEVYFNENERTDSVMDVYSGAKETPRSGMSPSKHHSRLLDSAKEEFDKNKRQSKALGEDFPNKTHMITVFAKSGPSIGSGVR